MLSTCASLLKKSSTVIFLILSFSCIIFSAPKKNKQAAPHPTLTVEEIARRSSDLQNQSVLESGKIEQLRADSASTAVAIVSASTSGQTQSLDNSISQSDQLLAQLRSQKEKIKQDSSTLLMNMRTKMLGLNAEVNKLQIRNSMQANELAKMKNRKTQLTQDNGSSTAQILSGYAADIVRTDSIIRAKQAEISMHSTAINKAISDSIQSANAINIERTQQSEEVKNLDAQITALDAQNAALNVQLQKTRQNISSGSIAEQQKINSIKLQKSQSDEVALRASTEIATLTQEKDKLSSQSDVAKRKFDSQRQPLVDALAAASDVLTTTTKEKNILKAHQEKLLLDSAIAAERLLYEQFLEEAARGKRNSTKLAEAKETDINALVSKLDPIRKKPEVMQRDAALAGKTLGQKRRYVDSLILAQSNVFSTLTIQVTRAQQNLDNFDKSLPATLVSAIKRVSQIDTLIQLKQAQADAAAIQSSTLGSEISKLESSLNQSQSAISSSIEPLENQMRAKNKERADVSLARSNAARIAAAGQTKSSGDLFKAMRDAGQSRSNKSLAEQQIQSYTSQKTRISQLISETQAKNAQAQSAQTTEKQKLDVSIANTENELASITLQINKLKSDSSEAVRVYRTSQGSLTSQASVLDAKIASEFQTKNSFASERDRMRLQQNTTIASYTTKQNTIMRDLILSRNRKSSMDQDLRSLASQRDALSAQSKAEAMRIDNTIAAMQQELSQAQSKKDMQSSQLSSSATQGSPTLDKTLNALRQKDTELSIARQEIALQESAISGAQSDSVTLRAKLSSAYDPTATTYRRLDSLIALKEREIADLRSQKDKARFDSDSDKKNQMGALDNAHQAILKQKTTLNQKKMQFSLLQSERSRLSADSANASNQQKNAYRQLEYEVSQLNSKISQLQQTINNLYQQRQAIPVTMAAAPPPPPPQVQTYTPVPTFTPTQKPAQSAAPQPTAKSAANKVKSEKILEQIYTFVGENKNNDAIKLFKGQQNLLSANLDAESFSTLKSTVEGIGGN